MIMIIITISEEEWKQCIMCGIRDNRGRMLDTHDMDKGTFLSKKNTVWALPFLEEENIAEVCIEEDDECPNCGEIIDGGEGNRLLRNTLGDGKAYCDSCIGKQLVPVKDLEEFEELEEGNKWVPKECHGKFDGNVVECEQCFDKGICIHAMKENQERDERDEKIKNQNNPQGS